MADPRRTDTVNELSLQEPAWSPALMRALDLSQQDHWRGLPPETRGRFAAMLLQETPEVHTLSPSKLATVFSALAGPDVDQQYLQDAIPATRLPAISSRPPTTSERLSDLGSWMSERYRAAVDPVREIFEGGTKLAAAILGIQGPPGEFASETVTNTLIPETAAEAAWYLVPGGFGVAMMPLKGRKDIASPVAQAFRRQLLTPTPIPSRYKPIQYKDLPLYWGQKDIRYDPATKQFFADLEGPDVPTPSFKPPYEGMPQAATYPNLFALNTLNIGMLVGGKSELGKRDVQRALETVFGKNAVANTTYKAVQYTDPDGRVITEPTAIVQLKKPAKPEQVAKLSELLKQEAISYSESIVQSEARQLSARGTLAGPKAQEWGPYNPEYVMTPSGESLADVVKKMPDLDTIASTHGPIAALYARLLMPDTLFKRTGMNADTMQDLIAVGGATIGLGYRDFSSWRTNMLTRVPPHIAAMMDDPQWKAVYRQSKKKLTQTLRETPVEQIGRLIELSEYGKDNRIWYEHTVPTLVKWFGPDAGLMAKILAAVSPLTPAAAKTGRNNVQTALDVYIAYKTAAIPEQGAERIEKIIQALEPVNLGAARPAIIKNLIRVFEGGELVGPKVSPFERALLEDPLATVGDTWIHYAFNLVAESGKPLQNPWSHTYMDTVTRAIAQAKGMTPAEASAAIWAGSKLTVGLKANDILEPFANTIERVLSKPENLKKLSQVTGIPYQEIPSGLSSSQKSLFQFSLLVSGMLAEAWKAKSDQRALSDEEWLAPARAMGLTFPPAFLNWMKMAAGRHPTIDTSDLYR